MRNNLKAYSAAIALGFATGIIPIAAQPAGAQGDLSVHAGSVEVPVNKSQVITADRPIAREKISNFVISDHCPGNRPVGSDQQTLV